MVLKLIGQYNFISKMTVYWEDQTITWEGTSFFKIQSCHNNNERLRGKYKVQSKTETAWESKAAIKVT